MRKAKPGGSGLAADADIPRTARRKGRAAWAVAAGNLHSLALRTDGAVAASGHNAHGQTDIPAGLSGATAIAAVGFPSPALEADGTVDAWGDYNNDQTNVPAGLIGVLAIAAGETFSRALKSDGRET